MLQPPPRASSRLFPAGVYQAHTVAVKEIRVAAFFTRQRTTLKRNSGAHDPPQGTTQALQGM